MDSIGGFRAVSPSIPDTFNIKIGSQREPSTVLIAKKILFRKNENVARASHHISKATSSIVEKLKTTLKKVFPYTFNHINLTGNTLLAKNTEAILLLIQSIKKNDTEVEGMFRIEANHRDVLDLESSIANGTIPNPNILSSHLKATLVKRLLEEIQLFDSSQIATVYDQFLNLENDPGKVIQSLIHVIQNMPNEKKELLQEVFGLIGAIVEKEKINKMTSKNLAILFSRMFAPRDMNSILDRKNHSLSGESHKEFLAREQQQISQRNQLMEYLINLNIQNKDFLFS